MTDEVEPSIQGNSDAFILANVLYRGVLGDWIQETSTTLLANHASNIDNAATPLDAFDITTSTTSFDVTIGTGEGFIGGAYVATDDTHTVTLDASTADQTIYVGWDALGTNTIIVGTNSAFNTNDPKTPVWDVDTDSNGVTGTTDQRTIGETHDIGGITSEDGSKLGRWIGVASSNTATGTPGDTQGEAFRIAGGNNDLVFAVETGDEEFSLTYNAYHDGTTWRAITSGPAYAIAFDSGSPGVLLRHTVSTLNADDAITWLDFQVRRNDLLMDGWLFWDGDNDELVQNRLGGPASDLSSYPLPPSDISGSAEGGTSGDILQSDGTTAEWVSGSAAGRRWTLAHTFTSTDTSTFLDVDTGTLSTTYDLYFVEVVYDNKSTSDNSLRIRLNGDASSAYNTNGIDWETSSFTRLTGRTEFQRLADTDGNEPGVLEATIRGGLPVAADAATYPYVSASFNASTTKNPGIDASDFIPMHGRLRSEHEDINRLEVWTTTDATGTVNIFGRNL